MHLSEGIITAAPGFIRFHSAFSPGLWYSAGTLCPF